MKLQVSELAKLTGVSVRTLHYYDTIGLLKPAEIDTNNGYRFYDKTSIEKLMGYYIFFNEIQPYELFMEALGNVTEVV